LVTCTLIQAWGGHASDVRYRPRGSSHKSTMTTESRREVFFASATTSHALQGHNRQSTELSKQKVRVSPVHWNYQKSRARLPTPSTGGSALNCYRSKLWLYPLSPLRYFLGSFFHASELSNKLGVVFSARGAWKFFTLSMRTKPTFACRGQIWTESEAVSNLFGAFPLSDWE
jgi:hypothetical protein